MKVFNANSKINSPGNDNLLAFVNRHAGPRCLRLCQRARGNNEDNKDQEKRALPVVTHWHRHKLGYRDPACSGTAFDFALFMRLHFQSRVAR
jgi:hypothetical protein